MLKACEALTTGTAVFVSLNAEPLMLRSIARICDICATLFIAFATRSSDVAMEAGTRESIAISTRREPQLIKAAPTPVARPRDRRRTMPSPATTSSRPRRPESESGPFFSPQQIRKSLISRRYTGVNGHEPCCAHTFSRAKRSLNTWPSRCPCTTRHCTHKKGTRVGAHKTHLSPPVVHNASLANLALSRLARWRRG